jgi:hypothetical protein
VGVCQCALWEWPLQVTRSASTTSGAAGTSTSTSMGCCGIHGRLWLRLVSLGAAGASQPVLGPWSPSSWRSTCQWLREHVRTGLFQSPEVPTCSAAMEQGQVYGYRRSGSEVALEVRTFLVQMTEGAPGELQLLVCSPVPASLGRMRAVSV